MSKNSLGVLILHGFVCSLDCIRPVESPLKVLGLPIRMPVLRGHGAESPVALRGVTWQDWVSDAETALKDLLKEVEKAIVLGHSMGGAVTIKLAAEYGEHIDSIILVAAGVQVANPMAPGRPFYFVTKALVPLRRLVKHMKVSFYPAVYADPDLAKYNTDYHWAPLDAVVSVLGFADVARKCLVDVKTPTLIIQSHND